MEAIFDWHNIDLVMFDVDGTLYNQKRLRMFMIKELILHSIINCSFDQLLVLRAYRRIREQLGDAEVEHFEQKLIEATAKATGRDSNFVTLTRDEWIERRPLQYLLACRYSGLAALFDALRARGKLIGILSDYPAIDKVAALNLKADYIVTARDEGVEILKPHPRGLLSLLHVANIDANRSVLIGDRIDRDGEAAKRAGAKALILSKTCSDDWQTFTSFASPVFSPILYGN